MKSTRSYTIPSEHPNQDQISLSAFNAQTRLLASGQYSYCKSLKEFRSKVSRELALYDRKEHKTPAETVCAECHLPSSGSSNHFASLCQWHRRSNYYYSVLGNRSIDLFNFAPKSTLYQSGLYSFPGICSTFRVFGRMTRFSGQHPVISLFNEGFGPEKLNCTAAQKIL